MSTEIKIRGAREHNLKNVNVTIPREKLVVISGLSGSGKSSLAFDTIYAEGQRRYVESLSAYARQFLGQLEKPDVDSIEGLSPAISIEQKTTHRNPRSTVGTVTEIYDYFRLILARIGEPHCPVSGKKLEAQSVDTIVDRILKMPQKHQADELKLQVLAPIVRSKKGEFKDLFTKLQKDGFVRIRVDKKIYSIGDEIKLAKNNKHDIEIVVDRLVLKAKNSRELQGRLSDSVETALRHGNGQLICLFETNDKKQGEDFFSSKLYSPEADEDFPEITHRLFSFNAPEGACPSCSGLGFHLEIHPELLIKDKNAVIEDGLGDGLGWSTDAFWYQSTIKALSETFGFSPKDRWIDLPPKIFDKILYGDDSVKLKYNWQGNESSYQFSRKHEGFINNLMRRYEGTTSETMRQRMEQYMLNMPCKECRGARLNKWALNVFFQKKNIKQLTEMSIEAALDFFSHIKLENHQKQIAEQAFKEILARLKFLNDVGVGYLSLDRIAGTLSGGEAQRIRLATQIGSALMGVLYVLDEPSIGLHQCDNERLIHTLIGLRDLGNTVIVVEHDEDTLRHCDYVIDVGPRAGSQGGEIVFEGTFNDLLKCQNSLTADYLSGRKKIAIPPQRREGNGKKIIIEGAVENNLKNVKATIPLGKFICVTGVSGSGKSTLINQILFKALHSKLHKSGDLPGKHKKISGFEHIDKVIDIDQSPIGRTPRSNPATYTGAFTPIRELFSQLPASKMKGYSPGRFSFNVKGGRCEACEGDGVKKIEMHFLADVYITCEVCQGKRYNRETLEVKYKDKNIHDVLDMQISEAIAYFEAIPAIYSKLKSLVDVGLGYIKLGQAATTLSGGEAQRVKLATELSKRSTSKTLYILDEPTTGLHFDDINQLLKILHRFVEEGNSVLVIEHNMDVIKTADHIIDLGPDGGDKGGRIIAEGTPEEVVKSKESKTGLFLKRWLG